MSLIGNHTLRGDTSPQVTGSVVNWIGDSIAPGNQPLPGYGPLGRAVKLIPEDFLAWAHLLSNGRILYGKAAGIGGQKAYEVWPRIDVDALSMGGNFCGFTVGSNDSAAAARTPAQFAGDIRLICAAIVSRGQIPILTTLVPYSAHSALMDQYRRFMIDYAADKGWPLVDYYSRLVDPASATAGYLSAYDSGDALHPNFAGKRVMGQALVDALTPYLPPWSFPSPTMNLAANSGNLLNNSQFLLDSNSDGTPDGWTKTGSGTVALTTGDTAINGNALRLTDSGASGLTKVVASISGTFGGHRIAFTGLVKVPGTAGATFGLAGNGGTVLSLTALGSPPATPTAGWTEPFSTWQRFYIEGVAPSGTVTLTATLSSTSVGGPSLDVSVAQCGVFDLTACGL